MTTKSQAARVQMNVLLGLLLVVIVAVCIWRPDDVKAVYFGDLKTVLLNGAIVLLFAVGCVHLHRALGRYAREEEAVADYTARRREGIDSAAVFDEPGDSIIEGRFVTIGGLFQRGSPINHSAISAIMLADESLQTSFPKFVHNVLILTGVFGTVSSLIFALIGASDVLQDALPGEGMGMMLLGMNTALTTTATAIVCYFFFTYFYQRLTDAQTWLFSRVEAAVLTYIIPEFAFDTETINHQTETLIRRVGEVTGELQRGVGSIETTLADLHEEARAQQQRWEEFSAGREEDREHARQLLARIDDLRATLVEGFRLKEQ